MHFAQLIRALILLLASISTVAACNLNFNGYNGPTFAGQTAPVTGVLYKDGRAICSVPGGARDDRLNGITSRLLYLSCGDRKHNAFLSFHIETGRWDEWTLTFTDRNKPNWPFIQPPKFVVRKIASGNVGNGGGFVLRGNGRCQTVF